MLSFSTCWNRRRHRSGEGLVEELLGMGIDTIELGHGLPVTLVEGIVKVVERGDVRVSSVHNFCPHPIEVKGGSPDCYEFTSHREAERRRAVRLTEQTIELAARVGAKVVVVHGGRVSTLSLHRQAMELVEGGEFLSKRWGRFKVAARRAREAAGGLYLGRLREALKGLLPKAEAAGVVLALENRERYEDVPSERELPALLEEMGSVWLKGWHDFGHARIKHNLGFVEHRSFLERMAGWLAGGHVHDVRWPARDHLVPGDGEINWEELLEVMPRGVPWVWELHPEADKDAVAKVWKIWQERWGR